MTIENGPPSRTLYCSNLNSKIAKPDLIRNLYILFSIYGPVLDVVALKTAKMRGQAHIVFADYQSSANAMKQLQGFELFGKEMRIFYAKTRSNILTRLEGGVGAAIEAESKAPSLFRSLPSASAPGTISNQASIDKQSIFNAPGPSASTTVTTQNTTITSTLHPQGGKLSLQPSGTFLEAPAPGTEPPASPGRKRQREDSEGDADARKKSPIPPVPQPTVPTVDVPARSETGSADEDDDDDDDEMEMSDED